MCACRPVSRRILLTVLASALVGIGSLEGAESVQAQSSSSSVSSLSSASSVAFASFPSGLSADLSVTGTGPDRVDRGSSFRYTFTVRNLGPAAATNVLLRFDLPAGVLFFAPESDSACRLDGTTRVLCNLGTLPNTDPRTVFIGLRTPFLDACSDITHGGSGVVEGTQSDPMPGNNQSQTIRTFIVCTSQVTQCGDGRDNDGDQRVDYPADPECSSFLDETESDTGSSSSRAFFPLPFMFGTSSSSMTSSSSSVRSRSSARSRAPVVVENVRVTLETDRTEGNSGDTVRYTIRVQNFSGQRIENVQPEFTFSPNQLTILDAAGATQTAGQLRWSLSLPASQVLVLRFSARVGRLGMGETITTNVRVYGAPNSPSAGHVFTILARLPQTGPGDYTGPLENSSRFLSPVRSGGSGIALFIVLAAIAASGTIFVKFAREYNHQ